jgi:hypothetical protein
MEYRYGCEIHAEVEEAVLDALLTCRSTLRKVWATARDDTDLAAHYGVDTIAELRAIRDADESDHAAWAAEALQEEMTLPAAALDHGYTPEAATALIRQHMSADFG